MAKRGKSPDASPHVYFYYISSDLELLESIDETVMQQSFLWDRLLVSVEPSVPSSYQHSQYAAYYCTDPSAVEALLASP